jgi:hypothetical protein
MDHAIDVVSRNKISTLATETGANKNFDSLGTVMVLPFGLLANSYYGRQKRGFFFVSQMILLSLIM